MALKTGVAFPNGQGSNFEPVGGEPVKLVTTKVVRRNADKLNQERMKATKL